MTDSLSPPRQSGSAVGHGAAADDGSEAPQKSALQRDRRGDPLARGDVAPVLLHLGDLRAGLDDYGYVKKRPARR
jgi:hypothetical protein